MIRLQKLIAGVALAFCITAPALAGPVTLKADITTEGRVTLGDLFEGAGRAANVVVAPAPPAGGSIMIDAATLQRAAITNGLSWTNDKGLRRVIIRAGSPVAAAGEAADAKADAKGVEVLTWTRSIGAGELITAEDLTWTTMAATSGGPQDADLLIGKVAKKPLRSGAVAALRDVGAPIVIRKDDIVTVTFNSGGVALSLEGKAMGSAAAGQTVAVMNMQSKKVIQALAVTGGRAVVGPEAQTLRAEQSLALR